MASTTNTETAAPPSGLLATSWLFRMATYPAAAVAGRYRVPDNVLQILEWPPASRGEQDTSNTVRERCREPYEHTGVGLVVFKQAVVATIAGAPASFRARDAIFELKRL